MRRGQAPQLQVPRPQIRVVAATLAVAIPPGNAEGHLGYRFRMPTAVGAGLKLARLARNAGWKEDGRVTDPPLQQRGQTWERLGWIGGNIG